MSPRKRNILVGVIVLIGLGVIAWMILLFAGRITNLFTPASLPVNINADRADGVTNGTAVYFLGEQVGKVTQLHRAPDNMSMRIKAEVDKEPPLPANLRASIRTQSAFGNAAMIVLETEGTPQGSLSAGATFTANYEGSSLLPKQFAHLADEIEQQKLIQHLDEMILTIRTQTQRAGEVLGSMQKLVGDPKMQEDVRITLQNMRATSESAARIGTDLEKFSTNLQKVSDQSNQTVSEVRVSVARLSATLDHFQSMSAKLDGGKGTAGMLLNDPKLYQGLVDTTRELNATIADLQRVIQQWEQEGVTIKLGK